MSRRSHFVAVVLLAAAAVAVFAIHARFSQELTLAAERAAQGSEVIATRCGLIETDTFGARVGLWMRQVATCWAPARAHG